MIMIIYTIYTGGLVCVLDDDDDEVAVFILDDFKNKKNTFV